MKKNFTKITFCLLLFSFAGIIIRAQTPVYDECANAVNLQVVIGATCTGTIDFNNNLATATPAGIIPVPGCGVFTDGLTPDVWFRFTALANPSYFIHLDPSATGTAADLAVAVYTGGCNGAWTLAGCADGAGMPQLLLPSTTQGTEYFIRVWSNDGTATGNFRICVVINMDVSLGSFENAALQVSPNPFSEKLTITLPSKNPIGSIRIYDALGAIVFSENQMTPIAEVNTSGLKSGIYFLVMESDQGFLVRKIVKV